MILLLHIAGGVALILYGVRLLRKGLDRLLGARLALWLRGLADNRFTGAAVGCGVAIVTPSSTSLAVLGADMVKDRTMRFDQLWGIMLGAAIGLTMMVQLIAFDVSDHAAILILIGVLCFQGFRANKPRGIGQAMLGLGLILLAMGVIRSAATSIRVSEDLTTLIELLQKYPWGLALLTAIITLLLQSSTATIGLVLGLSDGNVIGLDEALPCVVGVNVGLALTQIVAAHHSVEGRRLGLAMLMSRLSVAAIIISLLPYISPLLELFPGGLGRQVANAHTGFAIIMVIIWVPVLPLVAPFVDRVIPERKGEADPAHAMFLDRDFMSTPSLAFGQSLREIIRVAETVRSMLEDLWQALVERNDALCVHIKKRDDIVDALDRQIKTYLTELSGEEYGAKEAATQVAHLRYVGALETTADIIEKNLVPLVRKLIRTSGYFSQDGFEDLKAAHAFVMESFVIADTAFATQDTDLANSLLDRDRELEGMEREFREGHFDRLQQGLQQSVETSAIHLDILTYLKAIHAQLVMTAYPILEQNGSRSSDEH